MTDNAANIAVCNQALGMLGAEEITLAATTEQNYVYCATFFDDARDEVADSLEQRMHEQMSRPINIMVHIEPDTLEFRK